MAFANGPTADWHSCSMVCSILYYIPESQLEPARALASGQQPQKLARGKRTLKCRNHSTSITKETKGTVPKMKLNSNDDGYGPKQQSPSAVGENANSLAHVMTCVYLFACAQLVPGFTQLDASMMQLYIIYASGYIGVCVYREREREIYIYIYTYICVYICKRSI